MAESRHREPGPKAERNAAAPPEPLRRDGVSSLVVLAGAVAGVCLYLRYHPELITQLSRMSPGDALSVFAVGLLSLGANGVYQKVVSKKFGIDLRPKEWFGLAAVTSMGNYLTPFSGGLFARAAYLKRRHDFSYTDFLAVLAANYMIVVAVVSVTGIVAVLPLARTERSAWPLFLFFSAVLSVILFFAVFPLRFTGSRHRLLIRVRQAMDGIAEILRDRALLGKLLAISLFNVAVGTLLYHMAFSAIGSPVSMRTALLIYLLTSFVFLINITPGNFGVQEVAASLAAAVLGAGADMGFLASLIIRAATILVSFTLGPIFSYLLAKELAAAKGGTRGEASDAP